MVISQPFSLSTHPSGGFFVASTIPPPTHPSTHRLIHPYIYLSILSIIHPSLIQIASSTLVSRRFGFHSLEKHLKSEVALRVRPKLERSAAELLGTIPAKKSGEDFLAYLDPVAGPSCIRVSKISQNTDTGAEPASPEVGMQQVEVFDTSL